MSTESREKIVDEGTFWKRIKVPWTFLLDLIFPLECLGCSREGSHMCQECRSLLTPLFPVCFVCKKISFGREKNGFGATCEGCRRKTKVLGFFSPYSYKDTHVREMIHRLKYRRMRSLAPPMADILKESLVSGRISLPVGGIIIPIPLHRSRIRTRGFNQSEEIARALATSLSYPYETNILLRTRKTHSQVGLSRTEREENIQGSFTLRNSERIFKKPIILFDDVVTTGATVEEAACMLKKAGALEIFVLTFAR